MPRPADQRTTSDRTSRPPAPEPLEPTPSRGAPADGSVSVSEAALLLGCAERTVRERIKAGRLPAYRQPTPQGYSWRVFLTSDGRIGPSSGPGPDDSSV
jgi:excisionase family DNA binding protein